MNSTNLLFFKGFAIVGKGLLSLLLFFVLATPVESWTVSFDFESGTDGEFCGLESGGSSIISSVQSYGGTKSCQFSIGEGKTGFGQWGGGITYPENLNRGDELWLRLNTYFPDGFDYNSYGEGLRLKFLRFHTASANGANEGYNDWYITGAHPGDSTPFKWIYEGEQRWVDVGNNTDKIRRRAWETYEMYVRFDNVSVADGGMATIRLWKNGRLIADINNRKTLSASTTISDYTYIFTYWNGGSPKTQSMYVDNIILTSDRPTRQDSSGNFFIGPPSTPPAPVNPTGAATDNGN